MLIYRLSSKGNLHDVKQKKRFSRDILSFVSFIIVKICPYLEGSLSPKETNLVYFESGIFI